MIFGGNDSKMYVPATSGKRFDDVAGQDEAKGALTEIVDFLHDPEKYRKMEQGCQKERCWWALRAQGKRCWRRR